MLAYVFWHWPRESVRRLEYETRLAEFHGAMTAHPPRGFQRSAVLSITGARWTGASQAYEDWYLLEDFAALGDINEAAVSGARQRPHDDVAAGAGGGTAGVYKLISGDADFSAVRLAHWITKPAGMSYAAFRDLLGERLADAGVSLWQRQMTLGPATEFCLHAPDTASLPAQIPSILVPVAPAWPRG